MASKPVIRRGSINDIPAIVEMVGHFIRGTGYSGFLRFMPSAVTELAERVVEIGIIFVADDGNRLIGLIAGFPMEEPIGRQTQLDELVWWVEPEHRKGSVGPKLLRSFENWGRQKGLLLCRMVAPVGTDVGRYYERQGYAPVETSYLKRLR